MKNQLSILFYIVNLILMLSCHHTIKKDEAKDKIETLLNVSISNNIRLSNYEVSVDIHGKYIEKFEIYFYDKQEYYNIFDIVKPTKNGNFDTFVFSVEYGDFLQSDYKTITAVFDSAASIIKYTFFER